VGERHDDLGETTTLSVAEKIFPVRHNEQDLFSISQQGYGARQSNRVERREGEFEATRVVELIGLA
jgi:hypothetical protein